MHSRLHFMKYKNENNVKKKNITVCFFWFLIFLFWAVLGVSHFTDYESSATNQMKVANDIWEQISKFRVHRDTLWENQAFHPFNLFHFIPCHTGILWCWPTSFHCSQACTHSWTSSIFCSILMRPSRRMTFNGRGAVWEVKLRSSWGADWIWGAE